MYTRDCNGIVHPFHLSRLLKKATYIILLKNTQHTEYTLSPLMPILCEELICLQIETQRLLQRRGHHSTATAVGPCDEFSLSFFGTVAALPDSTETSKAHTTILHNQNTNFSASTAIQATWSRVCKEVILTARLESFAERSDSVPQAFFEGLPMATKLVATKVARRLGIANTNAAVSRFGNTTALPVRRPRQVTYSNLMDEYRVAWQQHQESQSRARLKALKENDADAYMECLQHTKLTSLLHIMELTHSFMTSIGAQLDKQQTVISTTEHNHQPRPAQHYEKHPQRSGTANDDYSRFKEYVASTKDEYKLVHKSAVYVERQPAGLHATLMPHQLVGLRFLASLHANNINGILADEMGVGKTIQTLAFLLCLKEGGSGAPKVAGPHLVLAPLSIVREWNEACEQFVKESMKFGEFGEIVASGQRLDSFDLVFLAAHRVRNVTATLGSVRWGYIVVDEAHKAVSNLKTITAQAICAIPYKHRLVLTGTPLNSDLQELWSLLNFINPNIFTCFASHFRPLEQATATRVQS
jgi:hypothetical protein